MQGLLDSKLRNQVLLSKEYAERHSYYDKVVATLKRNKYDIKLFNEWQNKKLKTWQFSVLQKLMTQHLRKVLWVVDINGNTGKTFLCNFMSILYGFLYFDGMLCTRDLPLLIDESLKGIMIDVSRAAIGKFDYASLEGMKNGVFVTGKYRGCCKRIPQSPVGVFANNFPDFSQLSDDRWEIVVLGEGEFSNVETVGDISPQSSYPFLEPKPFPNFDEEFDLRSYLENHVVPDGETIIMPSTSLTTLPTLSSSNPVNNGLMIQDPAIQVQETIHTSQLAGPSIVQAQPGK